VKTAVEHYLQEEARLKADLDRKACPQRVVHRPRRRLKQVVHGRRRPHPPTRAAASLRRVQAVRSQRELLRLSVRGERSALDRDRDVAAISAATGVREEGGPRTPHRARFERAGPEPVLIGCSAGFRLTMRVRTD